MLNLITATKDIIIKISERYPLYINETMGKYENLSAMCGNKNNNTTTDSTNRTGKKIKDRVFTRLVSIFL